ncbi:hypothetical protein PNK_1685 [Candidatus Protochlamydia naegleriophila]|uniref:Uncharacterized protein n=1 Tax=Candidatus Protochlamydia naegleriophila TaxID=389348 RepID=A0A0U5JCR7_9BACT|nr:hypothetical protein [Candidatus Protochlamydia naegleriophila]CUI17294.1 hypothetical protein PNK_1685 [Candidatus Protochlamydia naegleriophila]
MSLVGSHQPIQPQPFIEITEVSQPISTTQPISTEGLLNNHTIVITEEPNRTDANASLISSQLLGTEMGESLVEMSDIHATTLDGGSHLVDKRMDQIVSGRFQGTFVVDEEFDYRSDDDGYESDVDSYEHLSYSSDSEDTDVDNPENVDNLSFSFVDPNSIYDRHGESGEGNLLEGGNRLEGENPKPESNERLEGGGERVQERNLDEVNPGQVELGLRQANAVPLKVGEGEVNDIGQRNDIDSDVKVPPQKILRNAIALAKQTPGFENATVKVKSSLDQELRSDDATFKVETAVNDKGVLLYKVSVDYTIELKGDNDEVMTMTLNRVFYSNAANEKEALLAIYNVAKSVKQQATADNLPDGSLEQGVFNISLARDPKTKAITGIRSIKSENGIDFTPRTSGKTTFGRDIDERGQVRLRSAKEGEVEEGHALSKQTRLLRANIQFTDVPILDRLKKQKIDTKRYIDDQADRTRHLNDQFSTLKEQLVKDDLLKWIVKNKKNFNTQVDNILAGKVDPKGLPLSEKMQEYLSLRQQHVKIKPLVEEFTGNREAQESLKQMREDLRAGRELKPEDRDLINSIKNKLGVSLETPSDAAAIRALMDGVEAKQNALRRQIGSPNPEGKLVELEAAYAEARVGALKEHQGLFANLGQMQDIQRELKDKKSKLEELRAAIKADGNMPTDVAQWRLAMIEETVGKIDEQLEANAKVLNVESHLGKLFEQEVVSTPVRQTVVSSAPDQIE